MTDTNRPDHNPAVLQDDTPRAGTTPMLWLLLLLAVAAFAWWYFANRTIGNAMIDPDLAIIEGTADDVATPAAGDEVATTTSRRSGADGNDAAAAPSPRSSEPLLLSAAQPRYPSAERQRGIEGNVTLRIDVGANGVPTDVDYAHRSGNRALDRAALTAARNWRFQPAIRNGEAVASTVNVPVAFRL